ncbi:hypothetical protein TN53_43430, partial [Streptomyces sp. WM6386]
CKALMGNHELLLLGAKRFGDTPVNSGPGPATFQADCLLNGGQKTRKDPLPDPHPPGKARPHPMGEVHPPPLVPPGGPDEPWPSPEPTSPSR